MLFSIIIATHNRPALLDQCLAALSELNFPPDEFEVVVIDDGSTLPLHSIVERHTSSLPLRFTRQKQDGPATARNRGLQQATGRYVVFTDDDCRPHPDWLLAFQRALTAHPSSALGGAIHSAPENSIFGQASQLLVSYLYDHPSSIPRFFCTNNLAFPRQALLDLGGFDETFPLAAAEDRDICDRWAGQHPLHFVPGAIVIHRQLLNFPAFCRQQFRYGRGAFHFQSRRQTRGQAPLRIRPLAFYRNMFAYPWRTRRFAAASALAVLLAITQLANVLGFFYEERSSGPRVDTP